MKIKYPSKLLLFSFAFFLLLGCNDKDERFDRPSWLSGPIYAMLKEQGNCNLYIQCLDRTPYAKLLNSTSTYTVFAPTDSAFKIYLTEKGYATVADIPQSVVDGIVTYSIVDFSYSKDYLDKSSVWSGGWELADGGDSWRRKTMYLAPITVEDYSSATNQWSGPLNVIPNFNKTIAYFTDRFNSYRNFTSDDYSFLFPNRNQTNFNVLEASVVKADIIAENGYIHVTDKVLEVRDNVYEFLSRQSDYSLFKSLLDRLIYPYSYRTVKDAEGKDVQQYIKRFFNPYAGPISSVTKLPVGEDFLSFNPCNEMYGITFGDNAYQTDMSTLFVPNNNALKGFLDNVLLVNYKTLDKVPNTIIAAYINGLIQQKSTFTWPGLVPDLLTNYGDKYYLSKSNLLVSKVCSNGMFYGIDKAMIPSFFYSVAGFSYNRPEYFMYNAAIEKMQLRPLLSNKDLQFTLFAIPDAAFNAFGIKWDPARSMFYELDNKGKQVDAYDKVQRIMHMHIVYGKVDDLSGTGFLRTNAGDVVKFQNGKVFGTGNAIASPTTGITPGNKITSGYNGVAYELDRLMLYSDTTLGSQLLRLPQYSEFKKLLTTAALLDASGVGLTTKFIDINTDYTVFVPTNAAILAEKAKPNNRIPTTPALLETYLKNYFIPMNLIYTTDPNPNKAFNTMYVKGIVEGSPDYSTLNVVISGGQINITDITNGTASTTGITDVMANHGVIHQIDKVLNVKP